jgi:hypothetical protein
LKCSAMREAYGRLDTNSKKDENGGRKRDKKGGK